MMVHIPNASNVTARPHDRLIRRMSPASSMVTGKLVRDVVWVLVKCCFQVAPISGAKSLDDTQPGLNIRAIHVLAQRAACGLRQSWPG